MVLILLSALAAGFGVVRETPATFRADAELRVDSSHVDPLLAASPGLLPRYFAEQATSPRVLKRAAAALGVPVDRGLLNRVWADAIPDTYIVLVHAEASTGTQAAAVANAVAKAVVDQNRDDTTARPDAVTAYLSGQLTQKTPVPGPSATASGQNPYITAYQAFQVQQVATTRELDRVSIGEPARPPGRPISPDLFRYMLLALVAGMSLAVVAGLLLEQFDDRLFSSEAMAAAAGTSLVIGVDAGRKADAERQLLMTLAGHRLLGPGARWRRLLVVAVSEGAPAAAVAQALARTAPDGDGVVIVNDARSGAGGEIAVEAPDRLLAMMDALFGRTAMLVVAPPPSTSPIAGTVASHADGAVLVATARKTRAAEVRRAAAALREAGCFPVCAYLAASGAMR
jgi:capsular polysaccharide biosynthesis protein